MMAYITGKLTPTEFFARLKVTVCVSECYSADAALGQCLVPLKGQ